MVLVKKFSPMLSEIGPTASAKLVRTVSKEVGPPGEGVVSRRATPGGGGHCVGGLGAGVGLGPGGAGIAEQKVAKTRVAKAARIKERMVDR